MAKKETRLKQQKSAPIGALNVYFTGLKGQKIEDEMKNWNASENKTKQVTRSDNKYLAVTVVRGVIVTQ